MIEGLKVVAFDADDTLWENEPLFRHAEKKVADVLSEYGSFEYISDELYKDFSDFVENKQNSRVMIRHL